MLQPYPPALATCSSRAASMSASRCPGVMASHSARSTSYVSTAGLASRDGVMTTGSVRFSIVSALLVRVPLFGLSGGRDLARSGAGSPAPIQGSLLFVGSSLADSAAPGGGDRTGQFVP